MLTTENKTNNAAGIAANNAAGKIPFFQPKLTINEPGDQYEQEADLMAEHVMRMPIDNQHFFEPSPLSISRLQRKCKGCEDDEKLHRKENSAQSGEASNEVSSYIGSLSSKGMPLPENAKSFFEPRFGQDFSDVRIHNDSDAAKSSQAVNALAYTVGNNIVFNQNQFSPESDGGKRLLAHELTHVVQQNNFDQTNKIQRLGANNGCSATQIKALHQVVYDARGWINNMLKKVAANPNGVDTLNALRRNFGSTFGVASNLSMIVNRIQRVYQVLSNLTINCDSGADPICVAGNCGFTVVGSFLSVICPHTITTGGNYLIGCVLHEAFHATYSNFTVDEYSGWHGAAQGTASYPGSGIDPLLNADSYTSFVIDLS